MCNPFMRLLLCHGKRGKEVEMHLDERGGEKMETWEYLIYVLALVH